METKPYDPLAVLSAEAKASDERTAKRNQTSQRVADFHAAWRIGADADSGRIDPVRLIRLGTILREQGGGVWIDFLACHFARLHLMEQLLLLPAGPAKAFEILMVRLLRSAFDGDAEAVNSQLADLDERTVRNVRESFSSWKVHVEDWHMNDALPYTPLMTATELKDACGGRIDGFSKGNISKMIGHELISEDILSHATGKYRQFRHATLQRQVLSFVIPELKKSQEFSFIFPARQEAQKPTFKKPVSRKRT